MDLMITAGVALVITILSTLTAIMMKKSKWKILLFAGIGLLIGIPTGILIAPFIISFL